MQGSEASRIPCFLGDCAAKAEEFTGPPVPKLPGEKLIVSLTAAQAFCEPIGGAYRYAICGN